MRAPNENDSSGTVMLNSIKIAARVHAEPEVESLAEPVFKARTTLQSAMTARNVAKDATVMAEGRLSAAERRTDRELVVFGNKLKSALDTVDMPGDKHPWFEFTFGKKAPSTVLPSARDARTTAIADMEARVANEEFAGPNAKKEFAALAKAFAAERKALAAVNARNKALEGAFIIETRARMAVVVAVRAMAKDVQSFYAKSPRTARRVLGYANPAVARKRNAAARKAKDARAIEAPALPPHETTLPAHDTALPAHDTAVPAHEQALPAHKPVLANGTG